MASEQHTSTKIIQVFPAVNGWGAVYALENEDIITGPLVCWALVEEAETSHTSVIGMIAENDKIEFAPSENFLGYSYPNCTIDWKELARLKQNQ
ncbi:MAG: hypothetical protein J2P36_33705 [Ktedonobacteraceae bacterium]|nr:hypothetical protein [Ktedonobacteraceae bacterium]